MAPKRRNRKDRALTVADVGTPERRNHGDVIETRETPQAGVKAARVQSVTMIDRLKHRGHITVRQSDAAQRLREDWEMAGRQVAVVSGYGQSTGGQHDMTEKAALAQMRYVRALRSVGIDLSPVLTHVVLLDGSASAWAKQRGDTPQSGIAVLRLALDALARHYGLT